VTSIGSSQMPGLGTAVSRTCERHVDWIECGPPHRPIRLARPWHDTASEVEALITVGTTELRAGAATGCLKLQRALELARRCELEQHAAQAFSTLAQWSLQNRRLALAGELLDSGLEYCSERGLDRWRVQLLAHRCRLELDRGNFERAAVLADAAVRDPHNGRIPHTWALTTIGLVRARSGKPDALGPLDEARTLAQSTGDPQRIGSIAAAIAETAWLAGSYDTVATTTDGEIGPELERRAPWTVSELAYWRHCSGIAGDLPACTMTTPYGLSVVGDWEGAARRWSQIGCPYEAALALTHGNDRAALRQAHTALLALGAHPAATIAAQRLRRVGAPRAPGAQRARTRHNPVGLTARELEVLTLLVQGRRNREIALDLVVSTRTVDHHVSAILRKLDARTRGAASAKAAVLGLLTAAPGSSNART
jgi:DNA-binding CsgD family transcriptional regulator